ncbi:hypothetical protein [Pseudoduganella namucuonensis]|uniref:Uncharacterized protein n=1 Tax=Pseudoduganella namucuonensis TaxID=1035707 RepID=A0A1I7K607_9BURK|nr:hypothetical protein [Pseudoduganella namucuonensis]SFU92887.1 hypothetical protein SAMN05216552_101523 [Pseudoduganella namucuonensis]
MFSHTGLVVHLPPEAAKHSIAMENATAWPYEERRPLKVYAGDIPF